MIRDSRGQHLLPEHVLRILLITTFLQLLDPCLLLVLFLVIARLFLDKPLNSRGRHAEF